MSARINPLNRPTVYFVRPKGFEGPIKIGCSRDYRERVRVSALWSPFELEVIATIDGGFDVEHAFHAMFADHHERLEWFSWSPLLGEVVDAINGGSFDTSRLPLPQYVGLKKTMKEWGAKRMAAYPNHERAAA